MCRTLLLMVGCSAMDMCGNWLCTGPWARASQSGAGRACPSFEATAHSGKSQPILTDPSWVDAVLTVSGDAQRWSVKPSCVALSIALANHVDEQSESASPTLLRTLWHNPIMRQCMAVMQCIQNHSQGNVARNGLFSPPSSPPALSGQVCP